MCEELFDEYEDFSEKDKSAAEKRHNDWVKAIRKYNKDKHAGWLGLGGLFYDNLHQYSKNKIHCSCPMCSRKSNYKTKKSWSHRTYNPSHQDMKRNDEMNDELKELEKAG